MQLILVKGAVDLTEIELVEEDKEVHGTVWAELKTVSLYCVLEYYIHIHYPM